jgi:phytoene dehydrogenase-like protein
MKNITIIGAGLGGLSAGALLAKRGHSVIIIEQHNIVGGCATTFRRNGGFICEVGLHEMDGVYSNPKVVEVFEELGVYEKVEFVKPNEFFSVITKDTNFIMPDGIENAKEALISKFPKEKNAIEIYFKLIRNISEGMERLESLSWRDYALFPFIFRNILRYKSKTVTEVLDTIMKDDQLKLILNTNVQYYNDTPNTLSFLLHAVAQYSYFRGGGWFIKGGSGRLSSYLAKVIKDNGGTIITKATVVECKGRVVEYQKKGKNITIDSDIVISNLSPQHTYGLFKHPYRESREIADSLLTIYLGFSKNIKEVYGERAYSTFIMDSVGSVEELNTISKEEASKRNFVFVDYSQIDSRLSSSQKSFGAICMVDYLDEWRGLDNDSYKEKKAYLIEATLKKLERYYPNITHIVEYAEVGTAKTIQRYIKTPNATAYGFRPTPKQFFKVPKSKSTEIDNLYFVGQWVIGGGFSPAIMSGGLCAREIG